jgi:hypothetical protein
VATDSARECSGSVVSCVEIVGKSTRFLDITGTTCTASQLSGIVKPRAPDTEAANLHRSEKRFSFPNGLFLFYKKRRLPELGAKHAGPYERAAKRGCLRHR